MGHLEIKSIDAIGIHFMNHRPALTSIDSIFFRFISSCFSVAAVYTGEDSVAIWLGTAFMLNHRKFTLKCVLWNAAILNSKSKRASHRIQDMAAAIAAGAVTGTRRAIVRSEKFREWQRGLSSSRAAYVGRKHNKDSESVDIRANKKLNDKRQSNDNNAAKSHKGLEERDDESVEPLEDQRTKLKKQQQSAATSVQKEDYLGPKGRKKDLLDPLNPEGSDLHRCKHRGFQVGCFRYKQELKSQEEQQTNLKMLSRNRQCQMQKCFPLANERAIQAPQLLRRTRRQEVSPLPYLPTSRGIKRTKRLAHRLDLEEPLPLPLKLPKIHLMLTRKEIQEDWIKITGHKYVGKPRKSTLVQRGFGLCTSLACPSSIRYLNDH